MKTVGALCSGEEPSGSPSGYPEEILSSEGDTIPTRNGRELGEIWVSKVGTNF